jgi:SAM-dependent methyltransferase
MPTTKKAPQRAFDIAAYWQKRYVDGRDSGEGSRGDKAVEKASRVNEVVWGLHIETMIDWGCGDGQVLRHITEQVHYTGVDISPTVVGKTAQLNPNRSFILDKLGTMTTAWLRADLSLSMDVLFHLVNDDDYHKYLNRLFKAARKAVLIYSTNSDEGRTARHVFRRHWTPDVARMFPDWHIAASHPSPEEAGFYLYLKGE